MTTVSLLKYHALGNDFLIALDPGALTGPSEMGDDGVEIDKELVRSLCDRHRGIGADGLILARQSERADVFMELRNADGGRAETSGNGLRCLALALIDSGAVRSRNVVIDTDGGPVTALVGGRAPDGCADVTVSMGRATVGASERPAPILGAGFEARRVDIGNPHLVLIGSSLEGVDIAAVGSRLESSEPGGLNVEAVAPDGSGGLDLLVWERGVGLTEACGSGSCAAAAAARAGGLVSERVPVANPGGILVIELTGSLEEPEVSLSGPACHIARIEVDRARGIIG